MSRLLVVCCAVCAVLCVLCGTVARSHISMGIAAVSHAAYSCSRDSP